MFEHGILHRFDPRDLCGEWHTLFRLFAFSLIGIIIIFLIIFIFVDFSEPEFIRTCIDSHTTYVFNGKMMVPLTICDLYSDYYPNPNYEGEK